jgi:hypothetical protein
MGDGSQVWYLGGTLAEKGAAQSAAEVLAAAQKELRELLPWVDLSAAQWATLPVVRAEPRQPNLMRPDKAFAAWISPATNIIAAWPTKLTLAPNLAAQVEALLRERRIAPGNRPCPALGLPKPGISPTPWEVAFA